MKKLEKYKIKKILVISLSNIGDVILTCPVIDALMHRFPLSEISIVVGPKAESLFEGNPYVKNVYVFNKHQPFYKMAIWAFSLRKNRFDMVIDLRNTALSLALAPKFSTSLKAQKVLGHMKDKHLSRLWSVVPDATFSENHQAIFINSKIQAKADEIIINRIGRDLPYCIVGVGAANQEKQWTQKGFVEISRWLFKRYGFKSVLVGDQGEFLRAEGILREIKEIGVNLCGSISLLEFAWILKHSKFTLSNDSAVMHMASYFGVPTVGLFGPTDPKKYGPWGKKAAVVQSLCASEDQAKAMAEISVDQVKQAIEKLL
ncbi:MAG: glycosyltransferase family 9 protein [Candidatus Omnitrophica bacterium]|nr:glycosyltransferase family 9 protein [Candidatus Omnitrophota bacterium]